MKSFNILLVVLLVSMACKTDKNKASDIESISEESKTTLVAEKSSFFGMEITDKNAKKTAEMSSLYHSIAPADTIATKFTGKVLAVCPSKGCWMRLDLGNGEEAMVKFKDYGFFVPKDIAGKEVVVNGLAFVEEMTVDEQQHYAEDAGKSKEEIAQITLPKKTYRFDADGVILKN
ncbi:DUF4920 domain-containing protein [Cellulophaga sp. F20128]|uniref:DUF4920 domain-containing protein n=1 Tax=Cellulophaga sp. F20128 TaxID=2926413 RepID=UPI001FF6691C|nr:DUF4920 domain-containing protein [Cellulophaga sp. F20128]MCK0158501.1 DUF4920 domain-containing protein [Cellulophaga sp. F20128]